MDALTLISNIVLVTVPGALVGMGIYLAVRSFIRRDQELRLIELRVASTKETRLLKLQAYERMSVFLERIAPVAVISRVLEPGMDSQDLQQAFTLTLRAEFEHNLSQQIYISSDAWNLIVSSKDELIKAVNLIAGQLPANASGQQAATLVLDSIARSGQMLPTQTALEYLKNEARELF